jgi:hypothetical protein
LYSQQKVLTHAELIDRIAAVINAPPKEHPMNNTTNPLIGATTRETIENAAEALSAAVVLLADKHSGLCQLLMPVLDALEREDVAGDADAIDGAAEAFSAVIVLMAARHSDLCRLLMPILHALECATEGGQQPQADDAQADAVGDDPIAEFNRRAALVRAECVV